MTDRYYDWAARASAQICNTAPPGGECKSEQFDRVLRVVLAAVELSNRESRELMLKESNN